MSTKYLTQKQALAKADSTGGTNDFAKKSWLVNQDKFDNSKMSSYANNAFVIDDHIIKKVDEPVTSEYLDITLRFNFEGNTMAQTSNYFIQITFIQEGGIEGDEFACNHDHYIRVIKGTQLRYTLMAYTDQQYKITLQNGDVEGMMIFNDSSDWVINLVGQY